MLTPNESLLSESQLKLMGASYITSFPAKSPLKPVRQFDLSRIQSSSLVGGLSGADSSSSSSQLASVKSKLTETAPSNTLLQQWTPSSPQPTSSSTPQWQPYHSSPLAKKDSLVVPSYGMLIGVPNSSHFMYI